MSKDPAFLFYDGDAARDVSHMNRLERGAYFDLIQAQRKFGGYTVEQARKILGKDFENCWDALTLVLTKDGDIYFIEWVRESIKKRQENAEIQRKRIQDYWNKKKEKKEKRKKSGNTTVLPYVIENEIENTINKGGAGEIKKISPEEAGFNFYVEEGRKAKEYSDQMSKDYVKLCYHLIEKNKDGSFKLPYVLKIKTQIAHNDFAKLYEKAGKSLEQISTKIDTIQSTIEYHNKYDNLYLTINNWFNRDLK